MSKTSDAIVLQAQALVALSNAIGKLIDAKAGDVAALDEAKVQIAELLASDEANAEAVSTVSASLIDLATKAFSALPAPSSVI